MLDHRRDQEQVIPESQLQDLVEAVEAEVEIQRGIQVEVVLGLGPGLER